jgi:hypothetical protein
LKFPPPGKKLVRSIGDRHTSYGVCLTLLNSQDLETMLICLENLCELSQSIVKSLITDILTAIDKLVLSQDWKIRVRVPKYFLNLSNVMVG